MGDANINILVQYNDHFNWLIIVVDDYEKGMQVSNDWIKEWWSLLIFLKNTLLFMNAQHNYKLTIQWTGNRGTGTSNYNDFERSHSIIIENKVDILGSSDPEFSGDNTKHNPEELLLASISSCHMLWYLHLCAEAKIIVTDYRDNATGIMMKTANRGEKFTEVTLNPVVTLAEISIAEKANELHKKANELCFIANSVNFPVYHKPVCIAKEI